MPTARLVTPANDTAFTLHLFVVQVALAQSVPTVQPRPSAHGAHTPPPQSTSVSAPSLMPLLHDTGTLQTLLEQNALRQSAAMRHICPFAHLFGQMPPQSTSASLLSLIPLVQVGGILQRLL